MQSLVEKKQQLIDQLEKAASLYKERKASGEIKDSDINQNDINQALNNLLETYQNKLVSINK